LKQPLDFTVKARLDTHIKQGACQDYTFPAIERARQMRNCPRSQPSAQHIGLGWSVNLDRGLELPDDSNAGCGSSGPSRVPISLFDPKTPEELEAAQWIAQQLRNPVLGVCIPGTKEIGHSSPMRNRHTE
jgi:hypothetical protein